MKKVFKDNPKLQKCFCTSDGECFYQENDAKNHAKTLDDKTVELLENENFLEVVDSEDISDEAKEAQKFDQEAADKKAAEGKEAKDAADAKAKADAATAKKAPVAGKTETLKKV